MLIVPIVIALLLLPLVARVTDDLSAGGWLPPTAKSTRVDRSLEDVFGRRTTSHFLIFRDPAGVLPATDPRFRREVERIVAPFRADPAITHVYTLGSTGNTVINEALMSDDGQMSMGILMLRQDIPTAALDVPRIRGLVRSDLLDVEVGGWPATTAAFQDGTESDLRRAEAISLPVTLLLLVVLFGGFVIAGLPVLIAILTLIASLAAITLLSRVTETSIFSVNVVSMIGVAVAVDYALILVNRFREERARQSLEQALAVTIATAGRAIIVSGLAVAIGLLGLIAFGVAAAVSTGVAGAIVVVVTVALSLTALPAALVCLDWYVQDRPTVTRRTALVAARPWLARHPAIVALVTSMVLIGCMLPLRDLNPAAPSMKILPPSSEARQTLDLVDSSFSNATLSPVTIIASPRFGAMDNPRNLRRLETLTTNLAALPGVAKVDSVLAFLPSNTPPTVLANVLTLDPDLRAITAPYLNDRAAVIELTLTGEPSDSASKALINHIRQHAGELSGGDISLMVGGEAAANVDLIEHIEQRGPWVVGLVVLVTLLVLFVQFRSIVLPLKAIMLNLLSLSASFGALVWIFQEGHLSGMLHFEPLGYTIVVLPIMMFCFMFGLSMDYEVIMLSRIQEEWQATGETDLAIANGLAASSRIVTSGALTMLVIFLAFGTSSLQVIKAVGIGLAIAVVLDATVIRLLLLPATMQLLGRWNWWCPSFTGIRFRLTALTADTPPLDRPR